MKYDAIPSHWTWVPSLYMAKGLPYVVLTVISLMLFSRWGLSNCEITFYAAWYFLPWVLSPWISSLIRRLGTLSRWIVSMQLIEAMLLTAVSFCIYYQQSFWILWTLLMLLAIICVIHAVVCQEKTKEYHYAHEATRHISRIFFFVSLIIVQGVIIMMAGNLEVITRDISFSWSMTFQVMAGMMLALAIYHFYRLPKTDSSPVKNSKYSVNLSWGRPELYCVLYLFPYGMLLMMSTLYLINPPHTGGLGLSPAEYGLVMGTVGIIGVATGGALGREAIKRNGFKPWKWTMALAMPVPPLLFFLMTRIASPSLSTNSCLIFIVQVAIGFSIMIFRTYLKYMVKKPQQRHMCMAMSAVAFLLPNLVTGYLQKIIGYSNFFLLTTAFSLLALVAVVQIMGNTYDEIGKTLHHNREKHLDNI